MLPLDLISNGLNVEYANYNGFVFDELWTETYNGFV